MDSNEMAAYMASMSDADIRSLMGLSLLKLDAIERLLTQARTEEQRKFVTTARYIHIGNNLKATGEEGQDGAAGE